MASPSCVVIFWYTYFLIMTSDDYLVNKKARRKNFIRKNRAEVATNGQQVVTSKVKCSFCTASLRYKTYAR